jgi:hypothetical protein
MTEPQPQTEQHEQHEAFDFTTTLKTSIRTELLGVLNQMTNEFDLVFDYIPKENITKLRTLVGDLDNKPGVLEATVQECFTILKEHEANILQLTNAKKLKSDSFKFLSNIKLFGGLIDFAWFGDENKNTKRSLMKYLHSLYMSSCFFNLNLNVEEGELGERLNEFVETMKQKTATASTTGTEGSSSNGGRIRHSTPRRGQFPRAGQVNNDSFNQLFTSLLDNPDIMNMANDLSKDLQRENVDPMSLVSSLISGKPSAQLNRLVGNITSKIEQKLESGEINKEALESQASNIMNAVNESDLAAQLPMLQEALKAKKFTK